jgi:hypothetical protein
MPRKKIVKPKTIEDRGLEVAKKAIQKTLSVKSSDPVEIEWFMDGTLMFADGNYVTFKNNKAKILPQYLSEAEAQGCKRVSRETSV